MEFPDSALHHILSGHPDIGPYLPEICDVLAAPDYVFTRPARNTHIYCKDGILPEELPRYFVVYVQYNGDNGTRSIATAYPRTHLFANLFCIYRR